MGYSSKIKIDHKRPRKDGTAALFMQVIIDPQGAFAAPVYIGGPKSLLPAALEAVGKMHTDPFRLNGTGIANSTVIPILFQ